jgi:hypothetical protein
MSEEFFEGVIPCRGCLVRAVCQDLNMVPEELKKRLTEFRSTCLLPPQPNSQEKNYRKCLLECWANLGYRLVYRMSDGDKKEDPVFINPRLAVLIKELAYLSQWIINSSSWAEGKIYEFDLFEITHKLRRIESLIGTKADKQ